MKYVAPQIVVLDDALRAVRGNGKGQASRDNAKPHADNATSAAYEADE
jgi:hypothetical protein